MPPALPFHLARRHPEFICRPPVAAMLIACPKIVARLMARAELVAHDKI